ncbi:hypothetical protein [Sphingobacterium sp. 2149]|uniref:hypothetical protein n=1 Tax=Sphingobacterium sp. 2149 TaxID=2817763 RepID=UPI0028579208|nr:hypothetical protein [Sphingobacterium sp. 2149]MDR6734908.1 hypothetical protein [Sphingobacterium sp. 2149]
MEEIKELTKENFIKFIKEHSFEYKTAQKSLCFAIIERMYRRCKMDYYFKDVKVCSEKGIVVDGNHRYLAYLLAGVSYDVVQWTSSRSDEPVEYKSLVIDLSKDWDCNGNQKFIDDGEWLKEFKREEKL